MQRHGPSCLTGPLSRRAGKAFYADQAGDAGSTSRPALTEAERLARIERIRREIEAGTYDTPEKIHPGFRSTLAPSRAGINRLSPRRNRDWLVRCNSYNELIKNRY
jgi:hypothetical protein